MQVLIKEDILSGSKKQRASLAHTKERFDGFVLYAKKGSVCKVVAEHDEVLILELNHNRFPAHKSKTARI